MLVPFYTNQFKKDVKKIKKSGKSDIQKLTDITEKLINEKKLEPKHKDHILTGNYKNHRECHIEPDWLLIYRIIGKEIFFIRTGSHPELFG
ncbi:MAG TPA: type II toxin-antitoxin system YafQ family toxin [Candidatus Lokiarchaeia archaeon]